MVCDKSKKMYEACFKRLTNALQKQNIDIFNQQMTIEQIKEILISFKIKNATKNNYLKSLVYNHKINTITLSDKLLDDIQQFMIKNNEEYIERTKKGLLNDSLMNNYLEWPDIIYTFKHKILKDTDIKNIIITALYVLQPPRRLKDYSHMIYCKRKPSEIKKEFNYLILTKYPQMIFNNYKTCNKYGQQELFIESKELINLLSNYVDSYHIKTNGLLFPNGEEDFKKTLKNTFYRYCEKNISVSILRHSYITYSTKNNLLDLMESREELSKKMGHSVNTQLNYYINEKYLKNTIL